MSQAYPSYRELEYAWLPRIPDHWSIKPFRRVFRESSETKGARDLGVMLSVSGHRGVEPKLYSAESQMRTDDMLEDYRVVRPGQLAVNTMWLNYAGLGVSDYLGYVSPAYRSYWITEAAEHRYLHHLMRSPAYVQGYTRDLRGIRPNSLQMDRAVLMSWPVLLPPRPEQARIAAYLDLETERIDHLIDKQDLLIRTLSERRNSFIGHLMGVGEDRRLKNLASVTLGKMLDSGKDAPTDSKIMPYIRAANVLKSGSVDLENLNQMPYTAAEAARLDLRSGDVLVVEGGAIGRPAYLPADLPGLSFQKTLNRVRALPGAAIGRFLYYALLVLDNAGYHKAHVDTVSMPHLTAEKLLVVQIATPSLQEQERIVQELDVETAKIDALIAKAEQFIALAKERRAALISAAVTGQVDVREAC